MILFHIECILGLSRNLSGSNVCVTDAADIRFTVDGLVAVQAHYHRSCSQRGGHADFLDMVQIEIRDVCKYTRCNSIQQSTSIKTIFNSAFPLDNIIFH